MANAKKRENAARQKLNESRSLVRPHVSVLL
jgi:hypothetical protein